jgi:DNA-binding PadR family transcriptional regulator
VKARLKAPTRDTSFAILGLLSMGQELSGYDLVKAVEGSVGFFWTPAKSQIYAELKRVVSLGWATEREVPQSNRPDKRVYTLTPEGQDALHTWLKGPDEEPEDIKSVFLLKLFYGHLLDREDVIAKVLEYREWARSMLARYEAIDQLIDEHGGHEGPQFYPWVTLTYGIAHARCGVEWSERLLQELEEKGGKP